MYTLACVRKVKMRFIQDQDFRNINRLEKKKKKTEIKKNLVRFYFSMEAHFHQETKLKCWSDTEPEKRLRHHVTLPPCVYDGF